MTLLSGQEPNNTAPLESVPWQGARTMRGFRSIPLFFLSALLSFSLAHRIRADAPGSAGVSPPAIRDPRGLP